jgi:hypothetical protein
LKRKKSFKSAAKTEEGQGIFKPANNTFSIGIERGQEEEPNTVKKKKNN